MMQKNNRRVAQQRTEINFHHIARWSHNHNMAQNKKQSKAAQQPTRPHRQVPRGEISCKTNQRKQNRNHSTTRNVQGTHTHRVSSRFQSRLVDFHARLSRVADLKSIHSRSAKYTEHETTNDSVSEEHRLTAQHSTFAQRLFPNHAHRHHKRNCCSPLNFGITKETAVRPSTDVSSAHPLWHNFVPFF